MVVGRYFVMFIIYSFFGWIFETVYCMVKTKKWENRGFLYGPVCPIYGVGATSITIIANLVGENISKDFTWWQIFLVAYFGSAVLEYFTSWILEVRFHAYWWDYRDMPLNINGRICVPASFGFGVAGVFVVYILSPNTVGVIDYIPPVLMEILSIVLLAILVADLTLTVSELTHFERMVISIEESVDRHMEEFMETVSEKKLSGVIIDGSRVAAEKIKDTLVDMKDSNLERENYAKEKRDFLIETMETRTRHAVERVRGFKNSKLSFGFVKMPDFKAMENFRSDLKKYQEKIKKVATGKKR
ncbi:MAG: putative ABC transporter permease [Lachnospiraceae bacterium]|nr:putative ABC transporter permease [Lachnospiraceae bacterium]